MKAHICHESTMPLYDIFRFLVEKTCIHNNKRWNQDNDNVLKRWHFTNFLLFLFPVLSESVENAESALFAFHMLFSMVYVVAFAILLFITIAVDIYFSYSKLFIFPVWILFSSFLLMLLNHAHGKQTTNPTPMVTYHTNISQLNHKMREKSFVFWDFFPSFSVLFFL